MQGVFIMTHNLLLQNAHVYLGAGRFAESLLAVDGVIRAVGTNAAVAAAAPADCEVSTPKAAPRCRASTTVTATS